MYIHIYIYIYIFYQLGGGVKFIQDRKETELAKRHALLDELKAFQSAVISSYAGTYVQKTK